jgi:hypothetical protein
VASRMRLLIVAAVWASSLAGCGGAITVSFTREPHTVHLRLGEEIGVRKSGGECGSPWSTKPEVVAARDAPTRGDCSQETVKFKAIREGTAEIRGALPCRVPECSAMGASIPVIVTRK